MQVVEESSQILAHIFHFVLWNLGVLEYCAGSHKELFNPFNRFARFNRYAPFKPPTSFLPRDAGEDEGGGLNGLNDLNCLNKKALLLHHSSAPIFSSIPATCAKALCVYTLAMRLRYQ